MECIFRNDTATGDRAVSGFDNFLPMQVDDSVNELDTLTEDTDPSPTPSRKRGSEEGTSTGRRKRTKPHDDDSHRALALIAESSKKITDAIHMQATLDTLNHVNWQLITEKLEAMDLDLVDIMKVMKAFRSDGDLAKVFMSLTNTTIMRALVFEQLDMRHISSHCAGIKPDLSREIQEKKKQIGILEQRIIENGEASVTNASFVEMYQCAKNKEMQEKLYASNSK
ncbi:Kinesin motor domain-containing protein [Forsythia ovata]|uniref:Kinesin motor domain-containing protein n=1 Tax=Forsythia ovata TaxID=205694 RepID=A0ABD1UTY6_9LAMI